MRSKIATGLLPILAAFLCINSIGKCNNLPKDQEQSEFAVEALPIKHPVELPAGALDILRKNEYVLSCLQPGESPQRINARWFVGSQIHLDGPGEIDLVVQPRELEEKPSENACLLGANIGPFWIFRTTAEGYELVLEAHALSLTVQKSRTKGYRDIQINMSTAVKSSSQMLEFDGKQYRPSREQTREKL